MNAFNGNPATEIIIDSATIANGLISNSACGKLLNSATTIYINNDISSIGSYVTENYTITTTDKEGYVKYVKNI